MLKIAIVDDEAVIGKKIQELIEKHLKFDKTISVFNSGRNFFDSSERFSFDVVFLDIEMPDVDGFSIAGELKVIKPTVMIVFVSNKENLITNSIRFRPLAFIRKSRMESDFIENLDLLQSGANNSTASFHIEINDTNISVFLNDIVYFEMIDHDLYVKTQYNSYRKKRNKHNEFTLKKLYDMYNTEGFILVSRNYLINYRFVEIVNDRAVILKDGSKITISPRNVNEIKNVYQQFLMKGGIL